MHNRMSLLSAFIEPYGEQAAWQILESAHFLSPTRPRCVLTSVTQLIKIIKELETATPKQRVALPTMKIFDELEVDNSKVHMFSKAHDVSIRDSEINNVGGDLTINNYNVLLQPDSEPVQVPLLSNAIPFFHS